jgi:CRP-like cAMP-binding protein
MVSDMNDAIDTFLNSVKSLCPKVTESEIAYLESGLAVRELKAKHFFIHANTIQKEIGFIYSGLIRAFYIDLNGNEISVNFFRENRYATHYPAFITQTPSKYYFQCIEPTTIVTVSYNHIQKGFLFENAETRYLEFVKENPDLFNRVSLSHLASFLGIERQSLTRIRKKLIQS